MTVPDRPCEEDEMLCAPSCGPPPPSPARQKEDDINFIMQSRSSWKLKKYTFNVTYRPSDGIWSLEDTRSLEDFDDTISSLEDTRSPEDFDDVAIIRALVEIRGGQIKVGYLVRGFAEHLADELCEEDTPTEDALCLGERALAAMWTLIRMDELKIGEADEVPFLFRLVSLTSL